MNYFYRVRDAIKTVVGERLLVVVVQLPDLFHIKRDIGVQLLAGAQHRRCVVEEQQFDLLEHEALCTLLLTVRLYLHTPNKTRDKVRIHLVLLLL